MNRLVKRLVDLKQNPDTQKRVECWIYSKISSNQHMVNIFGNIICIILLTLASLSITSFLQMVGSQPTKLYSQTLTLNPQEDVNQYQFKFTKLDSGTLAAGFDTFYVKQQTITFSWIMYERLTRLEEQDDPVFFPNITRTDTLNIMNAEVVFYQNDTTAVYVAPGPDFLDDGDWQVQIRASRINKYGKEIWSKFSDSVAFHINTQESDDTPFHVPVFFNLRFH